MEMPHGRVLPKVWEVDVGGGKGKRSTRFFFPRILNLVELPVEGCPNKEKNLGKMRGHFMF